MSNLIETRKKVYENFPKENLNNESSGIVLFYDINDDNYKEAKLSVSVGVTFGVGKGSGGSSTCESMMQNADKALYHVKKNGKNAVHFYSEGNIIYE